MKVEILPQCFTVCKTQTLSPELIKAPFCFIGKTDQELSVVCPVAWAPGNTLAREDGWRCVRIAGQLEFSLVGILSRLSGILAEEHIGIFAVSTYDTDYILVKEENLSRAAAALTANGYDVVAL